MQGGRPIPPPGVEVDDYVYEKIEDAGGRNSKEAEGHPTTVPFAKNCSRRANRFAYRWRYALWFLGIIVIYILYLVFSNVGWSGYGAWYRHTEQSDSSPNPEHTVVLLGDSLINRPFQRFDFGGMLRSRLSKYPMTVWNEGGDGSTIAAIYDRLDRALAHNPDALILLWDSDASDIDESAMSSEEVVELRANYETTLRAVVNETLSYPTVKYMAIGGPCVYGDEGLRFRPERFSNKDKVFDAYREINKVVASSFNVDYLDVRTLLLESVPFYWFFFKWWITIDGEHFNYRGTIMWANMAADALNFYLSKT